MPTRLLTVATAIHLLTCVACSGNDTLDDASTASGGAISTDGSGASTPGAGGKSNVADDEQGGLPGASGTGGSGDTDGGPSSGGTGGDAPSSGGTGGDTPPSGRTGVKYIILKADDLTDAGGPNSPGRLSPAWQQFIQMVIEKEIKANLGIIGSMANYPGGGKFWTTMNELLDSGRFELWNHGWSTSAYPSYSDFVANQDLVKEKTGATMIAVGMPENKFNDGSYTSIHAISDIEYIMFGDASKTHKTVLARDINPEFPTFSPDYERFVGRYPGALETAVENGRDYFCLQVHPNNHTPEGGGRQTNLNQIIDFLIEEGMIFVTLSEYWAIHE